MDEQREKTIGMVQHEFIKTLLLDFGKLELTPPIENWFNTEWGEFKQELLKQNIVLTESTERDWERFFALEKAKIKPLIKQ
jgi:hypothetical protein